MSDGSTLRPKTGGRASFVLESEAPAVVYQATLYLPEAEHASQATIDAAGGVSFGAWAPPDPPAWLVEYARQFLRGEWRARQGKASSEPWPRRMTRWRAE